MEQLAGTDDGELYPVEAVEAAIALSIYDLCLDKVILLEGEADAGRFSPSPCLVFEIDLVGQCPGSCHDGVVPFLQDHIPMKALCGKILAVAPFFSDRNAIDKQFHHLFIGVDKDFLFLALITPSHRP